jgi:hypothetical protein
MRLAALCLVLASPLIAGCAGHSFDCAIGEVHSDCAPGTAGHEKRVQLEQETKTISAIDDARCRSYARDTQSYLECRRRMAEHRKPF